MIDDIIHFDTTNIYPLLFLRMMLPFSDIYWDGFERFPRLFLVSVRILQPSYHPWLVAYKLLLLFPHLLLLPQPHDLSIDPFLPSKQFPRNNGLEIKKTNFVVYSKPLFQNTHLYSLFTKMSLVAMLILYYLHEKMSSPATNIPRDLRLNIQMVIALCGTYIVT